jgi:hypothetical protein
VPWNKVHELSKHEFSAVHASPFTIWNQSPEVDSDDPSRYRAYTFLAITYLFLPHYVKFRNH